MKVFLDTNILIDVAETAKKLHKLPLFFNLARKV
jgi:hypothetical protein